MPGGLNVGHGKGAVKGKGVIKGQGVVRGKGIAISKGERRKTESQKGTRDGERERCSGWKRKEVREITA